MPAILGAVNWEGADPATRIGAATLDSLEPYNRGYSTERARGAHWAFWATATDSTRAQTSVATDEESGLAVLAIGRIFGRLESSGDERPAELATADEVLRAYRIHGPDFAEQLHGHFSAAVHDAREGRTVLVTDRFGTEPLYYRRCPDALYVASRVSPLVRLRGEAWRLDLASVACYLATRYVMGEHTFAAEVRRLRAATTVICTPDEVSERRYWRPRWSDVSDAEEPELAREAVRLLLEALARQRPPHARVASWLSGGLDSRTIAWGLTALGVPFEAHTHGETANCPDRRFARAVAQALGCVHREHELRPEMLADNARWAAQVLEGNAHLFHATMAATVPSVFGTADCVYDGHMGDWVTGGYQRSVGEESFPSFQRRWLGDRQTGTPLNALPVLLGARDAAEAARSRLLELTTEVEDAPPERRERVLGYSTYIAQFTLGGVLLGRQDLVSCCPYEDYHLFDFWAGLKSEWTEGQRLYQRIIRTRFGAAGRVPWQWTGLPPSSPDWAVAALRFGRRATGRLRRTLARSVGSRRHGIDPGALCRSEDWFAGPLRGFVRQTLFTDNAVLWEFVDRQAAASLVAQHESVERNNAPTIAALVSLALFLEGQEPCGSAL